MLAGISRRELSFARAPPPMLYIVQLSTTLPAFSPSNNMPLGWKGSTTFGSQTIWVGAMGSSTERIATSVRCPLPVAASDP